jgi:hypothetical protein
VTAEATLPASWALLPQHLRKPFWTIKETVEATGLCRSTIDRMMSDPRSGFPKGRKARGRVLVSALKVLIALEE